MRGLVDQNLEGTHHGDTVLEQVGQLRQVCGNKLGLDATLEFPLPATGLGTFHVKRKEVLIGQRA